jgi:putative nucleotidyltransferase with HDIG domain
MKKLLEILRTSKEPWIEIQGLFDNGELKIICPILYDLSNTEDGHKNNFLHTLKVLKNTCDNNFSFEMKVTALFHDIGKPITKRKIGNDWAFHNHEIVGANMFLKMCKTENIDDINIDYIYRMILHHGRIKMHRDVTESAIRRLNKEVGPDIIFDVINFSECDITTRNQANRERIVSGLNVIKNRIVEVCEKDEYDSWRSPLTGHVIMELFDNKIEGRKIGEIKRAYDDILRNEKMTLNEVINDIKNKYLL